MDLGVGAQGRAKGGQKPDAAKNLGAALCHGILGAIAKPYFTKSGSETWNSGIVPAPKKQTNKLLAIWQVIITFIAYWLYFAVIFLLLPLFYLQSSGLNLHSAQLSAAPKGVMAFDGI